MIREWYSLHCSGREIDVLAGILNLLWISSAGYELHFISYEILFVYFY